MIEACCIFPKSAGDRIKGMFRREWWAWQPAIGGGSTVHYLSIFSGTDFIQQRLESLQDLRLDGGKSARTEFSSITLFH